VDPGGEWKWRTGPVGASWDREGSERERAGEEKKVGDGRSGRNAPPFTFSAPDVRFPATHSRPLIGRQGPIHTVSRTWTMHMLAISCCARILPCRLLPVSSVFLPSLSALCNWICLRSPLSRSVSYLLVNEHRVERRGADRRLSNHDYLSIATTLLVAVHYRINWV
jgi:hypothetical protein